MTDAREPNGRRFIGRLSFGSDGVSGSLSLFVSTRRLYSIEPFNRR